MNISEYNHSFSRRNKVGRLLWNLCYWLFFRLFSNKIFRTWRNFVLNSFGAKIGKGSAVHSSVKIWAPWNLEMGDYACLGPNVDCYNQGRIRIGSNTTISQKVYLCASSHDISSTNHTLILRPIEIQDQVWIAADAFIGPGVLIKEGAVVAARSAVFKNVEPWTVVSGNPSCFLKNRIIIK